MSKSYSGAVILKSGENTVKHNIKQSLNQPWLLLFTLVSVIALGGCQKQDAKVNEEPQASVPQQIKSVAESAAILDCPLRDEPYSLNTPLLDILLNPEAKALIEDRYPGALDKLPPHLIKTETPSFAAILSVQNLLRMMQIPTENLDELASKLAQIPITDTDRKARCARYDDEDPGFELGDEAVQVLIFNKINGFDHGPSVTAATDAIQTIAAAQGWGVAVTDKGGAFTAETLAKFDLVVWNNVSGDALTFSQRKAFEDYINQGGGFLGIHGSGGDSIYFWDFYIDKLIGAHFIGHPMDPQFQDAQLHVESHPAGIAASLAPGWVMMDEWYSFAESPRKKGVEVVVTLDETTYLPEGRGGQNLRMGDDHPIVWTQCVGNGRAMYSAIGHRPEVYEVSENMVLLKEALMWASGAGKQTCGSL